MPEDLLEAVLEDEQVEQPEEGQEPEAKAEGEEQTPEEITGLFQADGRKLHPEVGKVLGKLKAENPSLGRLVSKAVQLQGKIAREFPAGLDEVRELRTQVEELGGVEGIKEKLSGLDELDGLAKMYMDGSPDFVEDLIASSPEAFVKLAPEVIRRYAELHGEAFNSYLGKVVYGDMQRNSLPLMMMRLEDLLPADNPRVKAAFDAINNYLGSWRDWSEKQPSEFKAKQTEQPKEGNKDRERELQQKEWNVERDDVQRSIVNRLYTKELAGRKPTTEEKAQIKELVMSRSKTAADRVFPGWQKRLEGYARSGNKDSYMKYVKAIFERVMPDAVASAIRGTLRGKAPASVTTVTKREPGANGTQQKQVSPAEGFKLVAKEPDSYDINYGLTSGKMLEQNRAVLRNGQKVQWR